MYWKEALKLSSIEESAKRIQHHEQQLRCPICHQPIRIGESNKLICTNRHSFDLAKQGYVNLLNQPSDSQYDKKLFASRRQIITETGLYHLLHKKIAEIVAENLPEAGQYMILDAGSGEGSHLHEVVKSQQEPTVSGIGIDISKEGVKMAAGQYKDQMWFVADLANLPIADQSVAVIMNILSPANYQEFKRVLVDDGLIIKVVPRSDYLAELREAIGKKEAQAYDNKKITSLFGEHFQLIDVISLTNQVELTAQERKHLSQMAPLAWHADQEKIDRFVHGSSGNVTVDLDVLVGKHS
ncbi:putative RNA methyltransferase [Allobacillus halotolerans]|uniref:putative RNA methyltransferase n=1 Tax=Allobacillus halotolerans TaxID=570278 RepID=UPI001FE5A358|nr:methyltransferase domain-containing protein [Allobacillus halotolerans]